MQQLLAADVKALTLSLPGFGESRYSRCQPMTTSGRDDKQLSEAEWRWGQGQGTHCCLFKRLFADISVVSNHGNRTALPKASSV